MRGGSAVSTATPSPAGYAVLKGDLQRLIEKGWPALVDVPVVFVSAYGPGDTIAQSLETRALRPWNRTGFRD